MAIASGSFSIVSGGIEFIYSVCGGIAIGALLGILFQEFSKRYLEPSLGVVFSVTIPYMTYITAHYFGFSGVLAVVTNGLIGARILLLHQSSLRRVLGYAVWDIFAILMNAFVFILIGLQLRLIVVNLTTEQLLRYTGYALFISLALVVVRMFWVYIHAGIHYIQAMRQGKMKICTKIAREAVIMSWSGMRGIVSLAAAFCFTIYSD